MTKKLVDPLDGEPEAAFGAVRTAPLRRGQRAKASTRSRKKRRHGGANHAGIHLRANKRIGW